jgi:hypothetical protein
MIDQEAGKAGNGNRGCRDESRSREATGKEQFRSQEAMNERTIRLSVVMPMSAK